MRSTATSKNDRDELQCRTFKVPLINAEFASLKTITDIASWETSSIDLNLSPRVWKVCDADLSWRSKNHCFVGIFSKMVCTSRNAAHWTGGHGSKSMDVKRDDCSAYRQNRSDFVIGKYNPIIWNIWSGNSTEITSIKRYADSRIELWLHLLLWIEAQNKWSYSPTVIMNTIFQIYR